MKKTIYNFVILPPETYLLSLDWPLYKFKVWFQSIVSGIDEFNDQNHNCLIKYRSLNQKLFFPVDTNNAVLDEDSGSFLKYCNQDTIIVGPLGSACVEALRSNMRYFSYDPLPRPSQNKAYFNQLNEMLYTANDKAELLNNINKNQIFRKGFSKINLLYEDGIDLNQIVKQILED
jgi:hypothetical protein